VNTQFGFLDKAYYERFFKKSNRYITKERKQVKLKNNKALQNLSDNKIQQVMNEIPFLLGIDECKLELLTYDGNVKRTVSALKIKNELKKETVLTEEIMEHENHENNM